MRPREDTIVVSQERALPGFLHAAIGGYRCARDQGILSKAFIPTQTLDQRPFAAKEGIEGPVLW
jgi:hypothetical protein